MYYCVREDDSSNRSSGIQHMPFIITLLMSRSGSERRCLDQCGGMEIRLAVDECHGREILSVGEVAMANVGVAPVFMRINIVCFRWCSQDCSMVLTIFVIVVVSIIVCL